MTVVQSRPVTYEAIQFTGDNLFDVERFVKFTGHDFITGRFPPHIDQTRHFINQRDGVVLTVVRGEWLLYNLSNATWSVCSDREFARRFEVADVSA